MKRPHLFAPVLLAAPILSTALYGQPRAVEVFGQIGLARAADDEGSLGTGASYGGALTVPFLPRLALDVDVQATRTKRAFSSGVEFTAHQALVNPGLVYRWPTGRAYLFAGGGVGAEISRRESRSPILRADTVGPPAITGFRVVKSNSNGVMLLGKAGLVVATTERLLMRVDFLAGFRFVLPNLGVRFGLGYRF